MNIQEYIQKEYINDYTMFSEKIGGLLCGHTIHHYFDSKNVSLTDEKMFFLVSYELNLLSQIFYNHFSSYYEKWHKETLPFVDCRCPHHPLPQDIIRNVSRESKGGISFSKQDILNADKYILEYLKEKLELLDGIQAEDVIDAIKNDPDCKPESILRYLK